MAHVVRVELPSFPVAGGAGEVVPVPLAEDNLGWLLICRASGEACAIDGPDAGAYLERCDALGVRLTTVWNTHTHGDHIGLNRDLQARGLLAGMRVFAPAAAALATPGCTDPVDEGSVAVVGALQAAVLRTDGHLDGHVSFYVPGAVFCGDTLFTAGCGYLFDGPPAAMWSSLQRLAALPDTTAVCCAHEYTWSNLRFAFAVEPENTDLQSRIRAARRTLEAGGSCVPSTMAIERATNPFLRPMAPTMRAGYLARYGVALPDDAERAFAALRAAKDGKAWRDLSDAALPR